MATDFSADFSTTATKDNIPGATDSGNGIVSSLTGLLTKAADTYVDQLALNGKTTVGSSYPTGQTNPAAAAAVPTQAAAAANSYTPYLIVGGIVIALVVVMFALKK